MLYYAYIPTYSIMSHFAVNMRSNEITVFACVHLVHIFPVHIYYIYMCFTLDEIVTCKMNSYPWNVVTNLSAAIFVISFYFFEWFLWFHYFAAFTLTGSSSEIITCHRAWAHSTETTPLHLSTCGTSFAFLFACLVGNWLGLWRQWWIVKKWNVLYIFCIRLGAAG